jgi:hypothetical protein
MCWFQKPPRPIANDEGNGRGGFEWNPDIMHLPFGTWDQLRRRQHCSICCLVLSLIVTDSETKALYPQLANVDPEVRGTGLYVSKIEDIGETVLTVECN